MDLATKPYHEKQKLAKELGIKVPVGTKGPDLDRMIMDVMPDAKRSKQEVESAPASFEFPGPPAKKRAPGAKPEQIAARDALHKRHVALWEAAKEYYENYCPVAYPRSPKPPKLEEGETKDAESYVNRFQLYRLAKEWFEKVDLVKITLRKPVFIGGRRTGPGKNIPVSRAFRDEVARSISRKKSLDEKLRTGKGITSYADKVSNSVNDLH